MKIFAEGYVLSWDLTVYYCVFIFLGVEHVEEAKGIHKCALTHFFVDNTC